MATVRKYSKEDKIQAVKLAVEIGQAKAAAELGISPNTIAGWMRSARIGRLDVGEGVLPKDRKLSSSEMVAILEQKVREQDKEIRELKEMNAFLEEASAFFAASRQKYAKKKG